MMSRKVQNVATGATGPTTTAIGLGSGGASVLFLNPAGEVLRTVTPADGALGLRVATADINGDGVEEVITGSGPGGSALVRVYEGGTGQLVLTFTPFESTFAGGVYVAAGDLDGDGRAEVVVTADEGGGPAVVVYSGASIVAGEGAELARFFGIDDDNFRGGARAALGDVDGDGFADLIVAAGFGGGPRVAVYDGESLARGERVRLMGDFFAFEETLRNGAFVAAGDLTGDGRADLIFGGGPGGGPRVRVFDGAELLAAGAFASLDDVSSAQVANFFAGPDAPRGGVRVAAGDATGDGRADLLAGSGAGDAAAVRVFDGAALAATGAAEPGLIDPFGGAVLTGGVFVG